MPPTTNARAITTTLPYSTLFTNAENSAPATSAGTVARPIITAKRRASGFDGRPGDDRDELLPVQPHHRQDRTELNHDREHAARIVESERPLADQQVRRRRDGQELGHPLHDAEERRFEEVRHEVMVNARGSTPKAGRDAEAAP